MCRAADIERSFAPHLASISGYFDIGGVVAFPKSAVRNLSVPEPVWWRSLSSYQWFVVAAASAAWLFDTLDQRLFTLARIPALSSLMHLPETDLRLQAAAKVATACLLVGWGFGGLLLGALGDH